MIRIIGNFLNAALLFWIRSKYLVSCGDVLRETSRKYDISYWNILGGCWTRLSFHSFERNEHLLTFAFNYFRLWCLSGLTIIKDVVVKGKSACTPIRILNLNSEIPFLYF